jgi:hypothetical protein
LFGKIRVYPLTTSTFFSELNTGIGMGRVIYLMPLIKMAGEFIVQALVFLWGVDGKAPIGGLPQEKMGFELVHSNINAVHKIQS